MRKIIAFSVLLVFATTSFCQQVVQKHSLTKEDYLQKSKKQKKIGWILIGSGVTLFAVSAIIPKGELTGEISYPCLCQDVHQNDDIKAALGLAGVVSALVSIPFFIASGKNNRRANAISASLKTDNASIVSGYSLTRINYPALSIKIALK